MKTDITEELVECLLGTHIHIGEKTYSHTFSVQLPTTKGDIIDGIIRYKQFNYEQFRQRYDRFMMGYKMMEDPILLKNAVS